MSLANWFYVDYWPSPIEDTRSERRTVVEASDFSKKQLPAGIAPQPSRPVLILTDLDHNPCPSKLINDWLDQPVHPNLMIRVAVREVESWLLADSHGLARYLSVRESLVPDHPDELTDPKATLIGLAARSRLREIKSRIVPKKNSTAKQGPDYNSCLATFVTESWDIDFAVERSPSLKRALGKFHSFTPIWPEKS